MCAKPSPHLQRSRHFSRMVSDPASCLVQSRGLHLDIENPAGEVVGDMSARINQDDWQPGMTQPDLSEPPPLAPAGCTHART